MEAGRTLDALVAEKVMGWQWMPVPMFNDQQRVLVPSSDAIDAFRVGDSIDRLVPHYSTNIADAWQLVERLNLSVLPVRGKWFAGRYDLEDEFFDDEMGIIDGHFSRGYAIADTAPMAICLAALKSVGITHG